MPEEKTPNEFPFPSKADFDAAPGDRITKGARAISACQFHGIPQRSFLLGHNDRSPVLKSLRHFVEKVYDLLDNMDTPERDEKAQAVRHLLTVPNIHPHQQEPADAG